MPLSLVPSQGNNAVPYLQASILRSPGTASSSPSLVLASRALNAVGIQQLLPEKEQVNHDATGAAECSRHITLRNNSSLCQRMPPPQPRNPCLAPCRVYLYTAMQGAL